ncbi:MAG TPA: pyruvate dehydrogenase complex dihydrolipoamide acetyltransferase [Dongiaceae bacterium]|jgi:pyruvate dehydrogenase E2 component (dihydrolipoamide acetyltransferase)|nr:pyruvate dehydrogenase complex dihydrolipoamide acetyltransferase [Dongiaceae bacterium]
MPTNILMPALSPTMTEGKLAKWLKNEGDEVKAGDVIAEIETDKATMEVEAVDEGKLQKILVPAGTEAVKVNEPIAVILGEGEDPSAVAAPAPKPSAPPAAKPAPAATATPPQAAAAAPQPSPSAVSQAAPAAAPVARAPGERIFASPLARRLAAEGGIDLRGLNGSGPHGRIVKADIEAAKARGVAPRPAAGPAAAPAIAPAPALSAAAIAGTTPYHLVPATTMRKVIARRMVEAKQQVPHFYLSIDCEIDQLLKLRADLNAKAPEKGEGAFKLSVNDFVIRASALALRKVPAANAAYSEEGAVMFDAVDISVAVAIPGGLITPILRGADQKGLATISNEMRSLAGKAKEGKLKPEEFQGGTFSISNLGMFGIREFQAVINPPQGAILAVGAGEQRPVVKGGALGIATIMTCTLSVDHRVLDGAIGAEFLGAFKKLVEDPITMLL